VFICPDCRSVYTNHVIVCERDQEKLVPVQANQNQRTYPLLNQELDGRYHLIGGLGQGGVGTVYLANHIHLDQLSAVKFLDMDLLGRADEEQQEESLQDFIREAKLAMLLRHEYVVRVMDYGVYENSPFLVMEYIPGPSLLRRMNAGQRFTVEQSLNIISRIAEALNAFHEKKLVHRDLKPANVILDPRDNGELTLVDLGLVKDLSSEARSSTHPLALRGTPGYLAPEQVPSWVLSSVGANPLGEKQPVDARVDIFALGVLAYELLAAQPPYPKGLSPSKVIIYTCTQSPAPIESLCKEIEDYPGLAELVRSMMAKKPSNRPNNGREVMQQVAEILEDVEDQGSPKAVRGEISRAQNALVQHMTALSNGVSLSDLSASNQIPNQPSASLIPSPASMHTPSQALRTLETGDGSTITNDLNSDTGLSLDVNPVSFNRSVPSEYTSFNQHVGSHNHNRRNVRYTLDEDINSDFDTDHTEIFDGEKTELHSQSGGFSHFDVTAYESFNHAIDVPKPTGTSKSFLILLVLALVLGLLLAKLDFNSFKSTRKTNKKMTVHLGSSKIMPSNDPKQLIKQPKSLSFKKTQIAIIPTPPKIDNSTQDIILEIPDYPGDPIPKKMLESKKNSSSKRKKRKSSKTTRNIKKRASSNNTQRTASVHETQKEFTLTAAQYRMLEHQVETLLVNKEYKKAISRLIKIKRKLPTSNKYYSNIKSLIEMIQEDIKK
jgi:serine/threonine protein kinase